MLLYIFIPTQNFFFSNFKIYFFMADLMVFLSIKILVTLQINHNLREFQVMRIHAALPGKDLIKQNLIIPKLHYNFLDYKLGDFWIQSNVVEYLNQLNPGKRCEFTKS